MTNIKPVTPEAHGSLFWQRFKSYSFAAGASIAPLAAAEIPRASLAMPLAFVMQNQSYILAGVLSPQSGENYFVDSYGRWLGAYVPSCFRGYPFSLAMEKASERMVLCVDESSGLLSESDGVPFFDQNGNLSQPVKDVLDFLQKVANNRTSTNNAVAALADAGVIKNWPMSLTIGGQEMKMEGLFRVDEAALGQLDDDGFLKLRKAGALPIAYAQLLSMGNTRFFPKLAQMRAQAEKQTMQEPPDLERLFGDDDIFKF